MGRWRAMSSEEEPVAWLREVITEDGRKAAKRLRRASSDAFRWQVVEKLARAKAELAILDLYERTLAIVRAPVDLKALAAEKPVIRELRARDYLDAERELCVLWEAVCLLAGGYKYRPVFPADFAA